MRYANLTSVLRWLIAFLSLLAAGTVPAQEFPNRAVHVIVPYPSGSTTDIIARLVAVPLSDRLKQPVVIDNKTGAGGIVGVNALKQASPNGYTIGLIVSGNAIQPWLTKDMPFDMRKDFIPITLMYLGQYVLTVPPAYPSKTFTEFIENVKANPKKVFFGSSGFGTTTHLAGEMLKQMASIEMTHVPFKGSTEVVASMLSGNLQAYFDLYGTVKPLIDSGRVRALAVSSKQRMAALPQLPAIAEYYPGFEVLVWTGFAAPLGTPKEAIAKLTAVLREVYQQPELRKRLAELGVDPGGNSPAEFAKFMSDEYEKWGKTIQAAGLKPQ